MGERHEVIVVGGRCAGSPLATILARAGLAVALVDRAPFPSDTLSTHIFQNEAVLVLQRLGVLEPVVATGAPWLERVDGRAQAVRFTRPWPRREGDPGTALCVRRSLLDAVLLDTAREAGAQVRTETGVTGLVLRGGRVVGVRVRRSDRSDGGEAVLEAPLVVGADGRGSTVARLTGARRYNVMQNQRAGYWGYYEGARWPAPATLFFHRWDDEFVIACPADSGLYLVVVIPPLQRVGQFRADLESSFDAHVARCEPVADILAGARRVDRPRAAHRWTCYFREAVGPGWVLTGDAGHFKDPAAGQGIADALRQGEKLAAAILAGLGGSGRMEQHLATWWRWRDADGAEMAWFAADIGQGGHVPLPLAEIVRRLEAEDDLEPFLDIFNHRTPPSAVLTPVRLLAAAGHLLRRGGPGRHHVLRSTWRLLSEDVRHRWLNRRPLYEEAGPGATSPVRPVG